MLHDPLSYHCSVVRSHLNRWTDYISMLYRYDGALSPLPLLYPSFLFPLCTVLSALVIVEMCTAPPDWTLPYRIRSSTVSVSPRLLKLLFILLFFFIFYSPLSLLHDISIHMYVASFFYRLFISCARSSGMMMIMYSILDIRCSLFFFL